LKTHISGYKKMSNTALLLLLKQSFTKVNSLVSKASKALSLTLSYDPLQKLVIFLKTIINENNSNITTYLVNTFIYLHLWTGNKFWGSSWIWELQNGKPPQFERITCGPFAI